MPLINTAGRHAVTTTSCEFGESGKGKPYVAFDFKRDDGATLLGFLTLVDKDDANKISEHTLKTLREVFDFDGNFETLPTQAVGKPCSIVTEFEPDEKGQDKLRVRWINPLSSVKPLANASGLLKSLTDQAKRIPPKAGTTPKPAPSKPTTPPPVKPTTPPPAAAADDADPFGTP
jgi:hypothetical protein